MPFLFPAYFTSIRGILNSIPGYYVSSICDNCSKERIPVYCELGEKIAWNPAVGLLVFANIIDCQIACDNLMKNGINSTTDLHNLSDERFRKLACENLRW